MVKRTLFACSGLLTLMAGVALLGDRWPLPGGPEAVQAAATRKTVHSVARPAQNRKSAKRTVSRRPAPSPSSAGRVAYQRRYVRGRLAHVVYADLNSPHVKVAVATAARGIGTRDSWSRMIGRVHPTAAITGTYFDVASALPIGTIVSRGAIVHRGGIGSLLAIRPDNQVVFAYQRPGIGRSWDEYETALRAGPRLVVDGRIRLTPDWEGFRDPAVYARKPRAAVGVTRHNKLVLATVSRGVLLREIAAIMQDLGAVDALCMDGGSSSGLYYRGRSYQVPQRALTNLLVIYDSSAQYRRYAPRLVPGGAV